MVAHGFIFRNFREPNEKINRSVHKGCYSQKSIHSGRHLFKELWVIFKPTAVRLSL